MSSRPSKAERPLASPTLAQLYLAQGHRARAQDQIDALLARDPFEGVALALTRRLAQVQVPTLSLEVDREVVLRWSIPPALWRAEDGLAVVLAVTPYGSESAPHFLSGPVTKSRDELHLPFPYARGSASACLAKLAGSRRNFRAFAVSPSASW